MDGWPERRQAGRTDTLISSPCVCGVGGGAQDMDETYSLVVSSDGGSGVQITANTQVGAMHALTSLSQLIVAAPIGGEVAIVTAVAHGAFHDPAAGKSTALSSAQRTCGG